MPGFEEVAGGLGSIGGLITNLMDRFGRKGREQRQERASNLELLNSFLTNMATQKALAPSRPFDEMLRNLGRAAQFERPDAYSAGGPGTAEFSRGQSSLEADRTGTLAGILNSLRNPSTYSLTPDQQGGYRFTPAIPQLASSTARQNQNTEFFLGGGRQFFGQAPPVAPGNPLQQQQRKPEDAAMGF